MEINVDRRSLTLGDDTEAVAAFDAGAAERRATAIAMARALARIDRTGTFRREGVASAVDLAVTRSIARARAVELLRLGLALDLVPRAESEVLEGTLSVADAAHLGKLARHRSAITATEIERQVAENGGERPDLDPDVYVRGVAERLLDERDERGSHAFRQSVRAVVESAAQGERVVHVNLAVGESTRRRFRRAQCLVTRSEGRGVTYGETFRALVDDYLRRKDDLWKEPRTRRAGPSAERPGQRYVSAEVERAVRLRSGDRCEVPGCGHAAFLQIAHERPHAAGGDREIANLMHLCTDHHVLFDAGYLRRLSANELGSTFLFTLTGEVLDPSRDDLGRDDLARDVEAASRGSGPGGGGAASSGRTAERADGVREAAPRWGRVDAAEMRRRTASRRRRRSRAPPARGSPGAPRAPDGGAIPCLGELVPASSDTKASSIRAGGE